MSLLRDGEGSLVMCSGSLGEMDTAAERRRVGGQLLVLLC